MKTYPCVVLTALGRSSIHDLPGHKGARLNSLLGHVGFYASSDSEKFNNLCTSHDEKALLPSTNAPATR